MRKTVQAKHIDDIDVLRFINKASHEKYPDIPDGGWVFTWDVEEAFADMPPKVVLAKLSALVKRGFLDGCCCGCRGDFELTAKGSEALRA